MKYKTMNILEVVLSSRWGSLETRACLLAKKFKDNGENILFAAPYDSQIHNECKRNNIQVYPIKPAYGLSIIFTALQFRKIIKEHEINIIHVHQAKDILVLNLAKKLSGTKCKIVFSQSLETMARDEDLMRKRSFDSIDLIIAASRSVAEFALSNSTVGINKIKLIYNGIDLSKFKPRDNVKIRKKLKIPEFYHVVGMVGRIDHEKHQDLLIRAAGKILEINPNTVFVIIGDETRNFGGANFKKELYSLIDNLELNRSFQILGYLPDIHKYLSALDVSISAGANDRFGLSIVESMAVGVPAIGAISGGIPEIIEDGVNGFLFEIGDEDKLSNCVTQMLTNPRLHDKLIRNGLKTVQDKFDIEKCVKEYIKIFDELIAEDLL